jgi:formylglycine-generating enzyme required for sulfatase activity
MNTDWFKFRIRLLTLLFSLAALLLIIIPSTKPSASAGTPQGKGGEVIAKPTPTPTPKKTTPTKRSPPRNSKTSQPAKSANDAASAEMIFWNSIKDSTNPDDFKAYLKKYPNGQFASLAENRLKTLEAPNSSTKPGTTNPRSTNPAATNPNPTTSNMSNMPRTRTNQTGIEFVFIPTGSFMMGSTNGGADEKPGHQVTISQAFYMGKYEVTQAQWRTVMGNNPSNFKDCGGNCPVEQVSWDDAQNFINKLNESNDGFSYRFPTEAEWEYACRAGTTGDYAGNLDEMAWYSENSGSKTHAVGGKQPNAWGLADMHGNAWEWCQDWYHNSYNGAPSDGSAWLNGGEQKDRVLRGGSWGNSASVLRSAYRYGFPPVTRHYWVGFRVVAVPRSDSNPASSTVSQATLPPNPPLPLHTFDFVNVTLDSSGKLKSREAKSANAYTEDLSGVKLEMVAIPPGEFMMGSPETEVGHFEKEGPQHRVRINYWFYMGEFEVTQAQWRAVMGTSPSNFKDCDDCPVEQVSWDEATEFCHKLSARTGRQYRLPSEAEWEYAARAGTTTPFAFGDTITPEVVNYDGNFPYANASKGTSRQKTVPVGSLGVANAFGLYDMHGNVWEWCQDWFHIGYSAVAADAPTDGSAWVTGGEQALRVARGGSWGKYSAYTARSAFRNGNLPAFRSSDFGFRVVAVR